MTHVPYRGDAPALADTIAGRVDLQIGGSAMLEQIRSGQVRGLAVTTAKRNQLAPELPTVAEAGVPDFDVTYRCGFSQRSPLTSWPERRTRTIPRSTNEWSDEVETWWTRRVVILSVSF